MMQTEYTCLVNQFGSVLVNDPYLLTDDGEEVITAGTMCYVTTCFDDYSGYFRAPRVGCLVGKLIASPEHKKNSHISHCFSIKRLFCC